MKYLRAKAGNISWLLSASLPANFMRKESLKFGPLLPHLQNILATALREGDWGEG